MSIETVHDVLDAIERLEADVPVQVIAEVSEESADVRHVADVHDVVLYEFHCGSPLLHVVAAGLLAATMLDLSGLPQRRQGLCCYRDTLPNYSGYL